MRVLLNDGWHYCAEGSLIFNPYEYETPPENEDDFSYPVFSALQYDFMPDVGFTFTTLTGHQISGPIMSILAVEELYTP